MTPTQKKMMQKELEALRLRKAKAETLPAADLTKHRALYDKICADIDRMERDLAAEAGGPARELLDVVREVMGMTWPGGALAYVLKNTPGAADELQAAEAAIVGEWNRGDWDAFSEAAAHFKGLTVGLNQLANDDETLLKQMKLTEVEYDGCPWK